ncbi:hypothetical protein [Streptacidiphilus sp. EB103A]|uniref:hypothetical protein n=1 Tax=Streptacidiphilus sp. EB103A TaxID=3156275 RepID=UPI00351355AF
MAYEEENEAAAFMVDLDPDEWLRLLGVDYVAGREADGAAETLNLAQFAVGLDREHARATANTRADGQCVVRLKATVYGACRLAHLLARAVEGG